MIVEIKSRITKFERKSQVQAQQHLELLRSQQKSSQQGQTANNTPSRQETGANLNTDTGKKPGKERANTENYKILITSDSDAMFSRKSGNISKASPSSQTA